MTPEFQNEVEEEFENQMDEMEQKVSENPKEFAENLQKEAEQHNAGYAPGQYSAATEFDSIKNIKFYLLLVFLISPFLLRCEFNLTTKADKQDILTDTPDLDTVRENWEVKIINLVDY